MVDRGGEPLGVRREPAARLRRKRFELSVVLQRHRRLALAAEHRGGEGNDQDGRKADRV